MELSGATLIANITGINVVMGTNNKNEIRN
jgi:hypothetical protein